MILILCLFFPPFLSLCFFNYKNTSFQTIKSFILLYVFFSLLVNSTMFIILKTVFNYADETILNEHIFSIPFTLKYILISCFFSLVYGKIYFYLHSNFSISINYIQTKKKKNILYIIAFIIILISMVLIFGSNWLINTFGLLTIEELIFHLKVPLKGSNNDFVFDFIKRCIPISIILSTIYFSCIVMFTKNRDLIIKFKKKILRLAFTNWHKRLSITGTILALIAALTYTSFKLDVPAIITYTFSDSSFIEENYISPDSVTLEFPEKKRNLIYIFMESMETTYISKELGGSSETNLIPELTDLAQENTHFSSSTNFQGSYYLDGTGWTVAAMVSQSSGLPLILPIEGNSYDHYETFLPGAITLGDILAQEGYTQTLMVGSDAEFGGRKYYYEDHGSFKVLDYNTAIEDNIISDDYKVWWGFEDKILYQYAKKELSELGSQDTPFNFTMLTVDTHHVGGYVCELCQDDHDEQYSNVISCASRQVSEFIEWIQEQPFYENTTIIISGDHLSMDNAYFEEDSSRYVFNTFINVPFDVTADRTINRSFTSLDMFPTTLAGLGVTIEGDKLGLGTNLFSDIPTITEEHPIELVNDELGQKSKFYNSNFLYDN